jgi:hypothetical protein
LMLRSQPGDFLIVSTQHVVGFGFHPCTLVAKLAIL